MHINICTVVHQNVRRCRIHVNVLLIIKLDLESYYADVSIGCSDPPQGEMNLDCVRLLFYRIVHMHA